MYVLSPNIGLSLVFFADSHPECLRGEVFYVLFFSPSFICFVFYMHIILCVGNYALLPWLFRKRMSDTQEDPSKAKSARPAITVSFKSRLTHLFKKT